MFVKAHETFVSPRSGNRVKVVGIVSRDNQNSREDIVEIVNLTESGKSLRDTARQVYADSLRRHYNRC